MHSFSLDSMHRETEVCTNVGASNFHKLFEVWIKSALSVHDKKKRYKRSANTNPLENSYPS